MKRITDLTMKEISELTASEIEKYINAECAYVGVIIPSFITQPQKPVNDIPLPTTEVFTLSGSYFSTYEQAYAVLTAVTATAPLSVDYDYPCSDKLYIRKSLDHTDYTYPEIKKVFVYTKEEWDLIKENSLIFAKEMTDYKAELAAYESAQNAYKEYRDFVHEEVREAVKYYSKISDIKYQYAKYLELAEGNHSIAYKFLLNANGGLSDYVGLKEELKALQGPAEVDEPA